MAVIENDYAAYIQTPDGEVPLRDLDAQEKIGSLSEDIESISSGYGDVISLTTSKGTTVGETFDFRYFNRDLSGYAGKEVMFEIICDPDIFPDGINFITFNGRNIEDKNQLTRYLTNVKHIVKLGENFAENTKTHKYGVFSNGDYVKKSGQVTVKLYPHYFLGTEKISEDIKETENNEKNLQGKTLWTLGDSLSENTWQSHFKDITGCEWDSNLNISPTKPISWGGSNSSPNDDLGTQARAINLASYKKEKPVDIIIIENINDVNLNAGNENDPAFMRSQKIVYDTGKNSMKEAKEYVTSNFSSYLSDIELQNRLKGTVLAFMYNNSKSITGSKIKFLTPATAEGDITITWDNRDFSVHVSPGMSTNEISKEFSRYAFGAGVSDVSVEDELIITYYTESNKRASFSGANTGVTAEVTDATSVGYIYKYFYGYNSDEWQNTEKWVESCSLYSAYKGVLEYLITEFPKAYIYWITPWAANVNFSNDTYKNSDGSWNNDKFVFPHKELFDIQKKVCSLYNIPVLELDKKSGMNIMNIETYFNSNNVHPKNIGYEKYASIIANMIGKLY